MPDGVQDNSVAIVGGTGEEGRGLALRWARAGLEVIIGSRDAARAQTAASEIAARSGGHLQGMENSAAVAACAISVLAVPFEAQLHTLKQLKDAFRQDSILITTVVPLAASVGDRASRILGVWQGSAAEQAEEVLPAHVPVAAAFHSISASVLDDSGEIDSDVIVCANHSRARDAAFALARTIPGVRPVNGGALENARIVESITAMLVGINIRYRVHSAGLRITGLPQAPHP